MLIRETKNEASFFVAIIRVSSYSIGMMEMLQTRVVVCCLLLNVLHYHAINWPLLHLVHELPWQQSPSLRRTWTLSVALFTHPHRQQAQQPDQDDTIRVRIWQILAKGDEISLKDLCAQIGERNLNNLRDHLQHVEKQAKTVSNKKPVWRQRRGLPPQASKRPLRFCFRRGDKNQVLV